MDTARYIDEEAFAAELRRMSVNALLEQVQNLGEARERLRAQVDALDVRLRQVEDVLGYRLNRLQADSGVSAVVVGAGTVLVLDEKGLVRILPAAWSSDLPTSYSAEEGGSK